MVELNRRTLLASAAAAAGALALSETTPARAASPASFSSDIDREINRLGSVGRELRRRLRDVQRNSGAPGVAFAVTDEKRLLYAGAVGRADIAKQRAFTIDTTHALASISKTFLATAVLQQVAAGKVQLNSDISDLLPYTFRNPYRLDIPLTFDMLLCHRGGMTEYGPDPGPYSDAYRKGDLLERPGEWAERCLALRTSDAQYVYPPEGLWTDTEPGTEQSYSNLPHLPMSEALSTAAGASYPDLVRDTLLRPLGIRSGGFRLSDCRDIATPHAVIQNGQIDTGWGLEYRYLLADPFAETPRSGYARFTPYTYDNYPDGGMRLSVTGLARYAALWLGAGKTADGRRLLPKSLVEEAFRFRPPVPEREDGGLATQQALAWYGNETFTEVREHDGADIGTSTYLYLFPEKKIAVMAISNMLPMDWTGLELAEIAPLLQLA